MPLERDPTIPAVVLDYTLTLHGNPVPVPPAIVTIDIKPGSDPNCFNINGHGVIPVSILGDEDFDVYKINLESVSFGGLEVRVRGNKGPLCSVEYSNEDACPDLVCQFEDDSSAWETGDGEATLTGELFDSTSLSHQRAPNRRDFFMRRNRPLPGRFYICILPMLINTLPAPSDQGHKAGNCQRSVITGEGVPFDLYQDLIPR